MPRQGVDKTPRPTPAQNAARRDAVGDKVGRLFITTVTAHLPRTCATEDVMDSLAAHADRVKAILDELGTGATREGVFVRIIAYLGYVFCSYDADIDRALAHAAEFNAQLRALVAGY